MKIYLASRFSRYMEMRNYKAQIECLGHIVTSRWINGTHELEGQANTGELGKKETQRFALEDIEDIVVAQTIISFTEFPDAPSRGRGGRHIEFGVGLALGKAMFIVGCRESVFHWLPQVKFFPTWEDCKKELS